MQSGIELTTIFKSKNLQENHERLSQLLVELQTDIQHGKVLGLHKKKISFFGALDDSQVSYVDLSELLGNLLTYPEYFEHFTHILKVATKKQIIPESLTYLIRTHDPNEKITCEIIEKFFYLQGDLSRYLPYNYYKYSLSRPKNKLVAHKDITLLTMIFSSEPGLEVYTNGKWHSIVPKTGHIVLIIGKILEVITGRVECPHKKV